MIKPTQEVNYLNVCAHCGECLKQLVWEPNKLNVVVYYRNEKGDIVEWKPELPKEEVEVGGCK